jgi:hypothetical protein
MFLLLTLIFPAARMGSAAVLLPAGKLLSVCLAGPVSSQSSLEGEAVRGVHVALFMTGENSFWELGLRSTAE